MGGRLSDCYKGRVVNNRPSAKTGVLERRFPSIFEMIAQARIRFYERAVTPTLNQHVADIVLKKKFPLPEHIELETYNRCNGECSFCPVNKDDDTRIHVFMSEDLFRKIIDELRDLHYTGRLLLFSNNEPLMDTRIYDFIAYAREQLPDVDIWLMSNGTLLTIPNFQRLIEHLDYLVLDNYDDEVDAYGNPVMIPSIKAAHDYYMEHKDETSCIVEVSMRKQTQVLSNRGGQAKNRGLLKHKVKAGCIFPYLQAIIRPDGKMSICCNDALGKTTVGDLSKTTLLEAWNSSEYMELRKKMMNGRAGLPICDGCDVIPVVR